MKRHQKIRAALSARGFLDAQFTKQQLRYLKENGILPPMAGGAPDDDDDTSDDDKSDDASSSDDKDQAAKDSKSSSSSSDSDDSSDNDDDSVNIPKSELQRLRRIAKESEENKKKAEKVKRDAELKKKQEEGRFDELLQEEKEATKKAEKERDEARQELVSFKREVTVTRVASRLGFRDPSDAMHYIAGEDADDEKVAERSLLKLLRDKPYLKSDKVATGAHLNGSSPGTLTVADVKRMSQEEINARWDEVQQVLQASGQQM